MNSKNISFKTFLILACLCLLLASTVTAQNFCKGDFAYDADVDADDVSTFLVNYGRSPFNNPCPSDGPAPSTTSTSTAAAYACPTTS